VLLPAATVLDTDCRVYRVASLEEGRGGSPNTFVLKRISMH